MATTAAADPAATLRVGRPRLGAGAELALAALPTITVLVVFAVVESFSRQRLLFASLASSAFLIYVDPQHAINQTKTLAIAQLGAAVIGFVALSLLGPGYPAAAVAMVTTIAVLVSVDLVHPPAISTCLAFAFKGTDESNLLLFALAVGMVVMLVLVERGTLWMLARVTRKTT